MSTDRWPDGPADPRSDAEFDRLFADLISRWDDTATEADRVNPWHGRSAGSPRSEPVDGSRDDKVDDAGTGANVPEAGRHDLGTGSRPPGWPVLGPSDRLIEQPNAPRFEPEWLDLERPHQDPPHQDRPEFDWSDRDWSDRDWSDRDWSDREWSDRERFERDQTDREWFERDQTDRRDRAERERARADRERRERERERAEREQRERGLSEHGLSERGLSERGGWPAPAPTPRGRKAPVTRSDPDDRYRPEPQLPIGRPRWPVLVGWIAIALAVVATLLAVFGLRLPTWAGWIAVCCFLGGFGLLVSQLPRHRPPDAGNGAVL